MAYVLKNPRSLNYINCRFCQVQFPFAPGVVQALLEAQKDNGKGEGGGKGKGGKATDVPPWREYTQTWHRDGEDKGGKGGGKGGNSTHPKGKGPKGGGGKQSKGMSKADAIVASLQMLEEAGGPELKETSAQLKSKMQPASKANDSHVSQMAKNHQLADAKYKTSYNEAAAMELKFQRLCSELEDYSLQVIPAKEQAQEAKSALLTAASELQKAVAEEQENTELGLTVLKPHLSEGVLKEAAATAGKDSTLLGSQAQASSSVFSPPQDVQTTKRLDKLETSLGDLKEMVKKIGAFVMDNKDRKSVV